MNPCDLVRMPVQYKLSVSGVTNGSGCSACSGVSGDFYLDWDAAGGKYKIALSGPCGLTELQILPEYFNSTQMLLHINWMAGASKKAEFQKNFTDYPRKK